MSCQDKRKVLSKVLGIVGLLGLLAGCGGGGKLDTVTPGILDSHNYTGAAYQSPNYHPYQTGSHVHLLGDTVYIGGDVEPREELRHVSTENGIRFYMGASRDGVGANRLLNYDEDLKTKNGSVLKFLSSDGFYPFRVQPKVWIHDEFLNYPGTALALVDSIKILNDALPPEFQIQFAGTFSADELPAASEGNIVAALLPVATVMVQCGENAVACASSTILSGANYTYSATLVIPDDFDATQYIFPRTVITHELLHTLGIQGHVDSIEFPDSLMGTSGDFFPNPGFTIHRIDREVLQIIYMSQRTGTYNDFGEWSDTTLHIVGRSEDEAVHFGVALFNGLPQPWARGRLPDSALADNTSLTGTVSWSGQLLAFSGPSPVVGSVELEVMLSSLDTTQDLKFRDLYFVNRFESDGDDRWFPTRNLDYAVDISGNIFSHTSTEGLIVGAFLGPDHEAMGGTIKRTDLVGAFGGTRPMEESQ